MTGNDGKKKEQQELGLYEQIATRTVELVESGKKSLDEALAKAREELSAAGDFTREQADKASEYVRRDLSALGENVDKARESLKKAVDPQRMTAGAQSVLARLLSGASGLLGEWAQKTEKQLEFKTGEVTSLGTLTCKTCQGEIQMKAPGHIPPCPKCTGTLFRKSY